MLNLLINAKNSRLILIIFKLIDLLSIIDIEFLAFSGFVLSLEDLKSSDFSFLNKMIFRYQIIEIEFLNL